MNTFPPSLGSCLPTDTIEICVLNPVVAPQLRLNTTAECWPEGEGTAYSISLLQRSLQPPTAPVTIAAIAQDALLRIVPIIPVGLEISREEFAHGSQL